MVARTPCMSEVSYPHSRPRTRPSLPRDPVPTSPPRNPIRAIKNSTLPCRPAESCGSRPLHADRSRFMESPRRLYENAKHLGDAPCLRDAAARRERRLGVEDLADRADRGLAEMRLEPGQEAAGRFLLVGIGPHPGVDKRADQPGPHRPLVIGRVAGPQIAEIARLVVRLAWRQRTQPNRGQELLASRVDDRAPALLVQHRLA